ncbi:hypothetical protein [Glycomyces dulcitolivorans]|nr:hypothetical protein [Glycomyces dulcitolivorans]
MTVLYELAGGAEAFIDVFTQYLGPTSRNTAQVSHLDAARADALLGPR